jgi:hypothetical protein
MTTNPTGQSGKSKFVDRFLENKILIAKSLIPDGALPDGTLERIGKSMQFYESCASFSVQNFGVHQKVFFSF